MTDARIGIEGIKSWATFCDAQALSFSAVFDQATTLADALQTIARCGLPRRRGRRASSESCGTPNQAPVMAYWYVQHLQGQLRNPYITV